MNTDTPHAQIAEIRRIFLTRLDTLAHLLEIGERHFADADTLMQARLAPDMLPFGAQIALACNQPLGFAQWCAGEPVHHLDHNLTTQAQAHARLVDTRARVEVIDAVDAKLDTLKRIGLGPGRYCELSGHRYVSDYLLPNLYFHLAIAYAILRSAGAPLGKADFMTQLAADVRREPGPA